MIFKRTALLLFEGLCLDKSNMDIDLCSAWLIVRTFYDARIYFYVNGNDAHDYRNYLICARFNQETNDRSITSSNRRFLATPRLLFQSR